MKSGKQSVRMQAMCCVVRVAVVVLPVVAADTERQLLLQEKEAFEVFRKEVLGDLHTQSIQLQVRF